MGLRWAFDGPDKYHETLLEATGPDGLKPMNEWDHFRSQGPPAPRSPTAEVAPQPSEHVKALESLLGHTWKAEGDWATGVAFHIQTTIEFVPYADGIYSRTVALTRAGEPTHLLDAYFYHHTGTNALRCLALSNRGGVYEGDLTVLDGGAPLRGGGSVAEGPERVPHAAKQTDLVGGALQLDLKGYEGDRVVPYVMRFDFEKDGTLHHRVWSLDGAAPPSPERTLMFDIHHKQVEPKKD